MVADKKNIYHHQLISTTISYFSTTKYNRPLLASCVINPSFFRKRPKTETLLIGSFTPLFFLQREVNFSGRSLYTFFPYVGPDDNIERTDPQTKDAVETLHSPASATLLLRASASNVRCYSERPQLARRVGHTRPAVHCLSSPSPQCR